MKTKKIVLFSVLLAFSLLTFMLESLFPHVLPIAPYVKIGLSNIFVLFVLVIFGEREALLFVILKCFLGSLILGNWYALPFNLSGGIIGVSVMILFYDTVFPKIGIISVSVLGAIASNIARTIVGAIIMETWWLMTQLPFCALVGVAGGVIVGAAVFFIVKFLPDKYLFDIK